MHEDQRSKGKSTVKWLQLHPNYAIFLDIWKHLLVHGINHAAFVCRTNYMLLFTWEESYFQQMSLLTLPGYTLHYTPACPMNFSNQKSVFVLLIAIIRLIEKEQIMLLNGSKAEKPPNIRNSPSSTTRLAGVPSHASLEPEDLLPADSCSGLQRKTS